MPRLSFRHKIGACVSAILLSSGFAQQTFRFDVASVKPSKNRNFMGVDVRPGGRLMANGSLALFVANAYRVKQQQIVDGPAWIHSDLYSIEAKGERSDQKRSAPCLADAS